MSEIYEVRRALSAASAAKDGLVARARAATRTLQATKTKWALAKVNAHGEAVEGTASGRKLEIEAAMAEADAELEVATLELKLIMTEVDCWKTQVSALQSEARIIEAEVRLS